MKENDSGNSASRALRTFLIVIGLLLLYAYAVDVTNINLEQPQEESRQNTTIRVIRALARPDFFEYNEVEREKNVGVRVPCTDSVTDFDFSGEQTVTLSPGCANNTQDEIVISGTGFRPNVSGVLRWHPPGAEGLTRALTSFDTDRNGDFTTTFTMPDIRPTEELQRIDVVEKWHAGGFLGTGIIGLSTASRNAVEKILETILLAFLATTIGTLLAIPFSFIAARNLMENVRMPLAGIMLGIVAIPVAWFAGSWLTRQLVNVAESVAGNPILGIVGAVVLAVVAWFLLFGSPFVTSQGSLAMTIGRTFLALVAGMLALLLLSNVGIIAGNGWDERLSSAKLVVPLAQLEFDAGLIGRFISLLSEFVSLTAPWIVGLLASIAALSFGSGLGQELVLRLPQATGRILTAVVTGLGSAIFVFGIGKALDWLYRFAEPNFWTWYPALIVGVIAGILAFTLDPKRTLPIGLLVYSVIRGILNIVRSIEPLVYVIVFAVWVGIGAFAGVLALSIHTIAALGKLFSEQVESIAEGPLEAITATGANGIQTIVFGVIPQIIPPFIAFTFYRWDINVRVSTILGFGGGGGIGFLLLQHINLLQYRQASVMMIAIALVVMTLDYFSSRIRSQII